MSGGSGLAVEIVAAAMRSRARRKLIGVPRDETRPQDGIDHVTSPVVHGFVLVLIRADEAVAVPPMAAKFSQAVGGILGKLLPELACSRA